MALLGDGDHTHLAAVSVGEIRTPGIYSVIILRMSSRRGVDQGQEPEMAADNWGHRVWWLMGSPKAEMN